MGKFIDLTGQVFKGWEAISYCGKGDWLCKSQCEHKTERKINTYSLTRGKLSSCRKCSSLHIGDKYNRLTLMKRVEPDSTFKSWFCRCDCGNEVIVTENALKTNHTKSCGCLQKETAKAICNNKKKLNTYDLTKDYGIGYTSKGEEFYFDLEDYDKIKDYSWCINDNGYVITNNKDAPYRRFHRLVLQAPVKKIVDHINHIRVDNRKTNLRFCSKQENSRNSLKRSKSGVIGVNFNEKTGKWLATIHVTVDTFEEAVKARLSFEKEYYKEFSPQRFLFEQYNI